MPQHIVDDDEFDLDVETLDDDDAALDDAMPGTPPAESEADEGTTPKSAAPQSEAEKPETDGEDDAIESYSKRVQKRINKLTTKMRQYESETAYWKERVAALEAKTNAREIADFQSQVDRTTADLERQIENARAAKKAAIEEGDIDRQIKTDDQILELREQLAEKRRIANAAKEQADKLRDEPKQPPAAPTSPISSDLPAGTQRWLRANPWFMKGEHPRAADVARALDAALQEEGYSPDDPAMYAELDRRLAVVAPQTVSAVPTRHRQTSPASRRAS